jgi:hypothetical protein
MIGEYVGLNNDTAGSNVGLTESVGCNVGIDVVG